MHAAAAGQAAQQVRPHVTRALSPRVAEHRLGVPPLRVVGGGGSLHVQLKTRILAATATATPTALGMPGAVAADRRGITRRLWRLHVGAWRVRSVLLQVVRLQSMLLKERGREGGRGTGLVWEARSHSMHCVFRSQ